jgi:tRNA (guanine-N7-)-methyltransferase
METDSNRLIHSYGRRRGQPAAPAPDALLDPRTLFNPVPDAVWLEIGFGAGEHLAAQAESHPAIGFIGAEPYINGMAGLLARVHERNLGNIRLWPDDIRRLLPALKPASLGRVFILFPDPWPKARHHKRRLITAAFLDELARIMAPSAELRFATDDPEYLAWTIERLGAHPAFERLGPGEDPHARPADWPATRYEAKGLAGHPAAFLRFGRRPEKP